VKHVELTGTGKEWQAEEELGGNAPNAPGVDWTAIGTTKEDFGGAIEARLDVRVHSAALKACAAEVDELYFAGFNARDERILGLDIAMYDGVLAEKRERLEKLGDEGADKFKGDTTEMVLLDELIQVHAELLEGDAQVVGAGEGVEHADDVSDAVLGAGLMEKLIEDANLDTGLVIIGTLALDHFHGNMRREVG
jgi:hypothetical protein